MSELQLEIAVHNFRGCQRAQVECAPIALVAGKNAAGKSSLAQAVGAALTGDTLPGGLASKGSAGTLVMAGATQASAEIAADDSGSARVDWPAGNFATRGEPPQASRWAAGLDSIVALTPKDRAQVLSQYLAADPTRDDLASALHAAGLGEASIIAPVWELIEAQGWDGAYQLRRDKGVELKGRWRQITKHSWGSRIGVAWRPEGWSLDLDEAVEDDLVAAVAAARQAHEAAIGAAAVSAARRQEMTAEAAELETRKNALRDAEAAAKAQALDATRQKRAGLPPSHVESGMPCPHCGGFVVIRQVNLAETRLEPAKAEVPAEELRQRRQAIAAADGHVSRLEGELSSTNQAVDIARAHMQAAAEAKNRLAQLPPVPTADPGLETAKAKLAAAEARLAIGRALAEAKDIHEKITSNERLLAILAADGLRAQKLTRVVDLFNRALAGDAQAAEWAPVTLGADMAIAYGGRPYALCSTSEQYRCRAMLAVAMARLDKSAMVVLDAADVLDGTTRSGLFALLDEAQLPALVTMTLTRREQVPDLAPAGLGRSYWLADGVAEPLHRPIEAAA